MGWGLENDVEVMLKSIGAGLPTGAQKRPKT